MSIVIDKKEYCAKNKLFFEPSKRFVAQITDLFDETWSFITGIKNFKKTFEYVFSRIPNDVSMHDLFVESSDVTNRPNLKKIYSNQSWNDIEFRISRNLLINLFAYYEAWCDDILKLLGIRSSGENLQFPYPSYKTSGNRRFRRDYQVVLSRLTNSSNMNGLYDVYKRKNSKKYCIADLNDYFRVYRLFKEIRNCFVHGGGFASIQLTDAYASASTIHLNSAYVKETPCIVSPVVGSPIDFTLRSVVGFSDVLISIVTTLDVEFLHSSYSEQFLLQKIREKRDEILEKKGVNSMKRTYLNVSIRKIMSDLYCSLPNDMSAFVSFVNGNGINVSLK